MTPQELEMMSRSERAHLARRQELWRAALEYALCNSQKLIKDMRDGHGIWFDAMGPLTPEERTLVLRELRKIWNLPPKS